MSVLFYNPKIEVKKSPIHGYGVFAKEKIEKDEIIEECHFISIPFSDKKLTKSIETSNLIRYAFTFPKEDNFKEWVWPLGNGCIYNSSIFANAIWKTDKERRLIIFRAKKDIEKDKEICHNYQKHIKWCKNKNLI
tara:strand:+ start:282 stop:686 length:405 start_codon:yes stop_codon:yes gene_type:complete